MIKLEDMGFIIQSSLGKEKQQPSGKVRNLCVHKINHTIIDNYKFFNLYRKLFEKYVKLIC